MEKFMDHLERALTMREASLLSEVLETIRHSDLARLMGFGGSGIVGGMDDPAAQSGLETLGQLMGMRVVPRRGTALSELEFPENTFPPEGKDVCNLKWRDIRGTRAVEYLRRLLEDCRILSLSGWSRRLNASDLWDGLRLDVARYLHRRDRKFIFHLGLPLNRSVYDIDEILDIISDFSICGKVTLLFGEHEAEHMWRILHGFEVLPHSITPELKDICQEIRNMLQIDFIVALCRDRVIVDAREGRLAFELPR